MGKYLDIVKRFEAQQAERGPSPGPLSQSAPVPTLAGWPERTADLIQWFTLRRAELPTKAFWLNRWMKVSDPATFYAALDQDIAQGPRGYRADGLADDLEQLFERWAIQREHEEQ